MYHRRGYQSQHKCESAVSKISEKLKSTNTNKSKTKTKHKISIKQTEPTHIPTKDVGPRIYRQKARVGCAYTGISTTATQHKHVFHSFGSKPGCPTNREGEQPGHPSTPCRANSQSARQPTENKKNHKERERKTTIIYLTEQKRKI